MSFKQLAVETARYHGRMAVRDLKYFCNSISARSNRAERDRWMQLARSAA
jgi:hypothetical protein